MSPTPDEMLKTARKILDEYVKVFSEGGSVDMSAFDNNARALCKSLAELPPTEAKKYEHTLQDLIDDLSKFRDGLIMQKDDLENQISDINQRNAVHNAYGNAMFIALQTAQNDD